jgi:hypothetical protein
MIVVCLLIFCPHGLSSVQQLAKQILEGKIQDDNSDWTKCYNDPIMANPGQYTGEAGLEKLYKLQGTCCSKSQEASFCVTMAEGCQAWADGDTEGLDAVPDGEKILETVCNSWCEEDGSPDWCSSGLSAGAIAGIVVGVVVVVGAVAGVLVYFFVLKKKPPVGGAAEPGK